MNENKQLHIIPALTDNYIWLLANQHQQAVIIDPGEATPVIEYLTQQQLSPLAILLTHHHADHVAGVNVLKQHYPTIAVYGPQEVKLPITPISSHMTLTIRDFNFTIISVPGHTLGHVAYYIAPYLFCGDTLFSAGCGRIFEGSYTQMFDSLNKLKNLPNNTIVCPAHEYTLANLKFAHHLLPDDTDINHYYQQVHVQKITLPTTLAVEKKINLFLRCDVPELQQRFNCSSALALFTWLRQQKDHFK